MPVSPQNPNRIARLRRAQGDMSRAELADRIQSTYGDRRGEPVSERTIARWEESGRFSTERAVEIAAIFGVSVDHLLGTDVPGRGNGDDGNGNGERVAA